MKPSEAMLKGFEMAGGKQCQGAPFLGNQFAPKSVCAQGAINLACTGNAAGNCEEEKIASQVFLIGTGVYMHNANDGFCGYGAEAGMSIPDIAGILAAEGY